jgi:tripartite-type tricarboxylate transporter receptor subunit TctC
MKPSSSSLLRRGLLASALALAALPVFAQAPAWPTKAVKLVVNFPAGGPLDLIARSVGDAMQKATGQPFVVENKPGAAGNIGADAVARAPGDGTTILFGIDTTFTINPHIYKSMPFQPADLKPVTIMASSGLLVGVNPGTGFKTLADMAAAGKGKPVTFSSAGNGSPGHLAAELFHAATGAQITHVPYKGNAPAVAALLSGEVNAGVLATPGLLPHVKAGKITALAVTSPKRSLLAPEIPTVAEAGVPQMQQEVLYLALVPAATPAPLVQQIEHAIAAALKQPEVQSRLQKLDLFPEGQSGVDASKRLAEFSARYGKLIRATGMKVE